MRVMTVVIRAAEPGEGRRIEEIRIAGWQDAYAGLLDADWLGALSVNDERVASLEQRIAELNGETHVLVVEHDGVVRGFAMLLPCRDEDLPEAGELAAMYVEPGHQAKGLGSALLTADLALMPQPVQSLWVLEGNSPARRFYERHGFAADGARDVLARGSGEAPELRYRRPRIA